MLTKLIGFITGREPVLGAATGIAGGVAVLYAVLEAFGVLTLTPKQVAAIGALAAWVAALLARRVVTPVSAPTQPGRIDMGPIDIVEGET